MKYFAGKKASGMLRAGLLKRTELFCLSLESPALLILPSLKLQQQIGPVEA
jgi:hypothetical protein